ncbi:hypothetical protein [Kitasatospora sp. NPDC087315]|uniref:hypothetical protein n=1 Tax=Kitasatospora sp. NPDC087315 TaxID=3364069 RepID=UPI003806F4D6
MSTALEPAPVPGMPVRRPTDLFDLKTIAAFISQCGNPVSPTTLWRWAARYQVTNWGQPRAALYSLSDMLEVHRDACMKR